jgi:hypothetical protein
VKETKVIKVQGIKERIMGDKKNTFIWSGRKVDKDDDMYKQLKRNKENGGKETRCGRVNGMEKKGWFFHHF